MVQALITAAGIENLWGRLPHARQGCNRYQVISNKSGTNFFDTEFDAL